jgi:hypothetical protein
LGAMLPKHLEKRQRILTKKVNEFLTDTGSQPRNNIYSSIKKDNNIAQLIFFKKTKKEKVGFVVLSSS